MNAISNPTVRSATPDDQGAVKALLEASDLPVDGVHDAFHDFFIAVEDGRVVGAAGIEKCGEAPYALLRSVVVHPEWKGRGVGHMLVQRAIEYAKLEGIENLYLLTTTAERYFPSFGFVATTRADVPAALSETVEFRSACPASATVMVLPL